MAQVNCILCRNAKTKTIKLFSRLGRSLNISEIISTHFWFPVEELKARDEEVCADCWQKTKSFNIFYNHILDSHLKYPAVAVKWESPLNDKEGNLKLEKVDEHPGNSTNMDDSDDSDDTLDFQLKHPTVTVQWESPLKDEEVNVKLEKVDEHPGNSNNIDESDDSNAEEMDTSQNDFPVDVDLEKKIPDYFQMSCELCSEPFPSMQDIPRHFSQKHNLKRGYLKCCDKKHFIGNGIMDHVQWHVDPDAFKCTICSKKYNNRRQLRMHMTTFHVDDEELIFKCEWCHKRFAKPFLLKHHVARTHPPDSEVSPCTLCDKVFKTALLLNNHTRVVHEGKNKFVCDICAKVMGSRQSLQDHVKRHSTGNREFKCDACPAQFIRKAFLIQHQKKHTGEDKEPPQTCDICLKVKPTAVALKMHKRVVHGAAKHKCTFCEKSFTTTLMLKEHVATHTGEALYTCPYCPMTFKGNGNKYSHLRRKHLVEYTASRKIIEKETK